MVVTVEVFDELCVEVSIELDSEPDAIRETRLQDGSGRTAKYLSL